MKVILGLDVGTSTTKVVAIDENQNILKMVQVAASDQKTALFGAVGKLLYEAGLNISDVTQIMLTGIGAGFVKGDLYGIPTRMVTEIDALGYGCRQMTGRKEVFVLGLGTGSVMIYADEEKCEHAGGSAVGGGTVVGLGSRLFGIKDIKVLAAMAEQGDCANVDWGIAELNNIAREDSDPGSDASYSEAIPAFATSSNLGKMLSTATDNDVIRGIFNLVYQVTGTMAVLASKRYGLDEIVVTGSMATVPLAELLLGYVAILYGVHFNILENAAFATAIGSALLYFKD